LTKAASPAATGQILAGPSRLAEFAKLEIRCAAVPAPFILAPAFVEITSEQQGERQIEMGGGEIRLDQNRPSTGSDCFLDLALPSQHVAEI